MISKEEIHKMLSEGLEDPKVRVENEYDDGEHFAAEVASPAFVGISLVKQHQLVYRALGDAMHSRIHALQLKTYTPDRWPY